MAGSLLLSLAGFVNTDGRPYHRCLMFLFNGYFQFFVMTIGKLNVDRVYRFCTINIPYFDKSALVNMVYG